MERSPPRSRSWCARKAGRQRPRCWARCATPACERPMTLVALSGIRCRTCRLHVIPTYFHSEANEAGRYKSTHLNLILCWPASAGRRKQSTAIGSSRLPGSQSVGLICWKSSTIIRWCRSSPATWKVSRPATCRTSQPQLCVPARPQTMRPACGVLAHLLLLNRLFREQQIDLRIFKGIPLAITAFQDPSLARCR